MPRTVVESITGATLAISASLPATYDQAGYSAVGMIYTEIGEIENTGNHGVSSQIAEFTPVATGITTKSKGAKNYGTKSLILGSVPSDDGQAMLDAASESNNHYSVKLTYSDGDIHYLDVLVAKFEHQDGTAGTIKKVGCDLAICRKPVKVLAP